MEEKGFDKSMGDRAFHNKTMRLKYWWRVFEVQRKFNFSLFSVEDLVEPEAKVIWLRILKESDGCWIDLITKRISKSSR